MFSTKQPETTENDSEACSLEGLGWDPCPRVGLTGSLARWARGIVELARGDHPQSLPGTIQNHLAEALRGSRACGRERAVASERVRSLLGVSPQIHEPGSWVEWGLFWDVKPFHHCKLGCWKDPSAKS